MADRDRATIELPRPDGPYADLVASLYTIGSRLADLDERARDWAPITLAHLSLLPSQRSAEDMRVATIDAVVRCVSGGDVQTSIEQSGGTARHHAAATVGAVWVNMHTPASPPAEREAQRLRDALAATGHAMHTCPECGDDGPHRIVDQPTGVVECRGCGIEINPSAAPQGGGPA